MNVICWSGGKDSGATVALAYELGIKIDAVLYSLLYFDKQNNIPAILPHQYDWIMDVAKPHIESMGFPVYILSSDIDYMYCFHKRITFSKEHPERIGKKCGFLLPGMCRLQREKVKPIKKFLSSVNELVTEYIGIGYEEPERYFRLSSNKISLINNHYLSVNDRYAMCQKYGLLSPHYNFSKRDGCWFCPNQTIGSFARLKKDYPVYYDYLLDLSYDNELVSDNFSYSRTFLDIDCMVCRYLKQPEQLTIDF